jgi:type IV pilus assembly protein PilM
LVGVDFGTRAIKMLQVREQRHGLRVVGAGRVDLKYAWLEAEPEALAEQLRAAFSSGGFTGRRCVVSLPRSAVAVQSVRLPRMPDEELRQAAQWEASQRFGFERGEMEADLIRTGAELQGSENREEILLIAAPHDRIKPWLEPLLSAGLRPVALETHFTALARAFSRHSSPGEGVAIVDVGAAGSTVLIIRGDQIAFCKPISIGGDQFDQAVAEHLQMEVEAARELRGGRNADQARQEDDGPTPAEPSIDRAVYDAVRPLFGAFAKEVMLCISYYGVVFRGHPPDKLILTGGDGLEPKLAETLAQHCKLRVVQDHEVSQLTPQMGRLREILHRAPGPPAWWTVAAGLSLRGLSRGKMARGKGHDRQEAA